MATGLSKTWLLAGIGMLVGVISLFAGEMADSFSSGKIPGPGLSFGPYLLAAATFSLAYSPALRGLMPTGTTHQRIGWPAVHLSTVGFALFLIPTLVVTPDSTGAWLPDFYAASILIGWMAWQLPFVSNQAMASQRHRLIDWDRMPYAPFVVVALVLLIASPICSGVDRPDAAIQLANWAYGFLLLAVLTASCSLLLDRGNAGDRLGRISRFALPVAALTFFPMALLLNANSSSPEEKQVITDVYPSFLAQQLAAGDMLISDSPVLRLGSIPRIAPSLSLDPDRRGLALWDDLTRALDNQRRVLWINVPAQSHDTFGTLATFLKANGCLDYVSDTSLPVRVYELNKPFAPPSVLSPFGATHAADAFDPATVNFGPIEITGSRFERRACSHDSVAVALRWQLPAKTASPLRLSLFLKDAKGRRVQVQDFYIDDTSQRHTDQWQPGALVPAYYLLIVPLGTPPGNYELGAAVYPVSQPQWLRVTSADGFENRVDHVELGTVQVYRAADVSADPWKTRLESGLLPANAEIASGLALDGYEVIDPTIIPGESLHLALRWRATKDELASYTTKVELSHGNKVIVDASGVPVDGTYPTDQWKAGEFVTERRDVHIPADSAGGSARLQVSVEGGQAVYLADINIEPITRTYQMPSVGHSANASFKAIGNLVAFDLPKMPVAANQPFDVTFYWQASATAEKDYTVFAQLLAADGHLIAQSDSQPGQGHRPTRSWLPGEIISDPHSLNFSDQNYRGDAKLIVGLYDAETGDRVSVEGGTDSFFLAPMPVQIAN